MPAASRHPVYFVWHNRCLSFWVLRCGETYCIKWTRLNWYHQGLRLFGLRRQDFWVAGQLRRKPPPRSELNKSGCLNPQDDAFPRFPRPRDGRYDQLK